MRHVLTTLEGDDQVIATPLRKPSQWLFWGATLGAVLYFTFRKG